MPNFNIAFDRLSFWLGFLAATLFWWVFSRIRPMFPQWREQLRETINTISQRNLSGVETYLRQETLRRAQRQHLAAPIFALDEILVPPALLLPPDQSDPGGPGSVQSMAGQFVPYLPDWPELVAGLGVPAVTPLQALQSGRHLAFVGQPGSGRTVALAHLATQIARRDPDAGPYAAAVPMYMHAVELDTTLEEGKDPLLHLIKAISSSASVVMQPQMPRYLKTVFRDKQRRVVLLLDGLDELPAVQLAPVRDFLTALLKRHPRLQVVTTASVDYLDGLTQLGFLPLAVAAWSPAQRTQLAHQWGELWTTQLLPEIKKQGQANEVDPLLVDHWLESETAYTTPLEWTLRLWGAYAGDLLGSQPIGIIDAHITRFLPGPVYIPALETLAHEMALRPCASLSYGEMEKILSAYKAPKPVEMPVEQPEPAEGESAATVASSAAAGSKKPGRKNRRDVTVSQGEEILAALIHGGVLVEHANHQVRFASPVFLGFLAGTRLASEEAAMIAGLATKQMDWQVYPLALQFAAACTDNPDWIYPFVDEPAAPLFGNTLAASRWLRDISPKTEWRADVMRSLVHLLQNEALPLGTRARMIAAFYLSRDPSTGKLFKQLLASPSAVVRRLALLGCGALGSPQLINDMLALLADTEPSVRYTACMALAAIPGEASTNALAQVLLTGDEEIRQAAAEALAHSQPLGHKILEEAATFDDLLTRRAAVFGLVQVREEWARKALEKLAVEDGQWVVRNAAAQALETVQQSAPALPKPLPRPSDSPWLLTFASKLGMGILPGTPATDVLLMVLKSGTVEEQIAALNYLREQNDEGVIGAIYHLLYSDQAPLHEPALHALRWISAAGTPLPSPTQFGLG